VATQIAASPEPPAAVEPEPLRDANGELTTRGERVYDELFGMLSVGDDYCTAAAEARRQIESGEADELARQLDEPPPPFPPDIELPEPTRARLRMVLRRPLVVVRRVRMRVRTRRRPTRSSARAPARPSDDPDLDLVVAGGRS
jgi:hypothetical protein